LAEAGGNGPGSSTLEVGPEAVGTTGSVNIFAAPGSDIDAADLNFFSSDTSVATITGGTAFNPVNAIGAARFDSDPTLSVAADGGSGNLFAVRVLGSGIDTILSQFDPLFDETDGSLVASIDFALNGGGSTTFSFGLGDAGLFELPSNQLSPTFASATLTVIDVPEPSSAILLIMGSVAMVARRRRA